MTNDQQQSSIRPDNLIKSKNLIRNNYKGRTKTVGEFNGTAKNIAFPGKFDYIRYITTCNEKHDSSTAYSQSFKYLKKRNTTLNNKKNFSYSSRPSFVEESVLKAHAMSCNNGKPFVCHTYAVGRSPGKVP